MPFSISDFVILALLSYFCWRGWRTGIFRTLISPIMTIAFSIIGIIYIDVTADIIKGLFVIILGSCVSSWGLKVLLMIGRRSLISDYSQYVFIGSRLMGAVFNFCWKALIFVPFLFILSTCPPNPGSKFDLGTDINNSKIYILMKYGFSHASVATQNIYKTLLVLQRPEELAIISDSKEYTMFFENPIVQALKSSAEMNERFEKEGLLTIFVWDPLARSAFSNRRFRVEFSYLIKKVFKEIRASNQPTTPLKITPSADNPDSP